MTLVQDILSREWDMQYYVPLAGTIVASVLVSWLISSWQSWRQYVAATKAAPGEKSPPSLPSVIPFIDHSLHFMRDGAGLFARAAKHLGRDVPVRVNLMGFSSYVISGPEAIATFLKNPTRELSSSPRTFTIMEDAFGYPHEELHKCVIPQDSDPEGPINMSYHALLAGSWLGRLTDQLQDSFASQVLEETGKMGSEWAEIPDLMVEVVPNVADDYFDFDRNVYQLFRGLPKRLSDPSLRARDKLMDDITQWRHYVQKHCDIDDIPDDVAWEPCYGSKSSRTRQRAFVSRGVTRDDTRAAEDLANMFATNVNAVKSAVWFLLETLHNPGLEFRVRERIQAAHIPPSGSREKGKARPSKLDFQFDVPKLEGDPLLQSIFAEVLRMRVAGLMLREPNVDEYSLNGWRFKRGEAMSLSMLTESNDPEFWNTGKPSDPHPLNRFWAERFLVNPADPTSGPLKNPPKRRAAAAGRAEKELYFSLDGTTWNWLPFGGGRQLCPGRHFAKAQIMLFASILLTAFDIEILMDKMPSMDQSAFAWGAMPPKEKVPGRIRRRQL